MKFYLAGLRLGEQILMNPHDFENKGKNILRGQEG